MRPPDYLYWLLSTIGVCALATIALAIWVDPYRMYGTAPVHGWTELKPRSYEQAEIAKTYQLERIKPETLLLGNSRVEVGFDPDSLLWPSEARPVFNAALAGRDLSSAFDMLMDSVAVHPPRTVIVGLDFLDFLKKPDTLPWPVPVRRAEERRLLVDEDGNRNPDRRLQGLRDRLRTTLTIDALTDSLKTLLDQDTAKSVTMTPNGFNPLHEYQVFVHRSGYHELFAQKNDIYEREYSALPKPDFADQLAFANSRYLVKLIALARRAHIRLVVFIHPYHSDYLDIIRRAQLWPSFENWKRALVKVRDDAAGSDAANVPLYDFSGYNRFSTEPVPPSGDQSTEMRWYWELGHYKSALGDEMLRVIMNGETSFGRLLTRDNIEDVLAEIRAARVCFLQQGHDFESDHLRCSTERIAWGSLHFLRSQSSVAACVGGCFALSRFRSLARYPSRMKSAP